MPRERYVGLRYGVVCSICGACYARTASACARYAMYTLRLRDVMQLRFAAMLFARRSFAATFERVYALRSVVMRRRYHAARVD